MARNLLVHYDIQPLPGLSQNAEFVALLEEQGALGAAVTTLQQAEFRGSGHEDTK